ncbi:MAG: hypothetical protein IKN72_04085 [Clostridia bacterium]|nr:hypothetical protein [Clostridia bacterium]
MSHAGKTALGAMAVALSVILMLPTVFNSMVYALPAFAGMLTLFCVIELGRSWAFGVYVAAALLSLLLLPNKEAAVMYTAFFGYYPIVKAIFEGWCLPRIVEYLLKLAVFNLSVVAAYLLMVYAFGLPFNDLMGVDEASAWARYAIPFFLGIGNVTFLILDLLLTRMATIYLRFWQKKLRRLFRFK